MHVVQMGDIALAVVRRVKLALPYVEEDILTNVVRESLPSSGIVIEATKQELRDNPSLGGLLYHDVVITSAE